MEHITFGTFKDSARKLGDQAVEAMKAAHLEARLYLIELKLREKVREHILERFGNVDYYLDVFDSDNGDDDWLAPLAVNLAIPSAGIAEEEPAYALCDGGIGSEDEQADYLWACLRDEITALVK